MAKSVDESYRKDALSLLSGDADDNNVVVSAARIGLGRSRLDTIGESSAPVSPFVCFGCGSDLMDSSGKSTIRLRSVGRGRTRRRRASRKRARQHRAKQQASVSGGRQWRKEEDDSLRSMSQDIYCVGDGSCFNAVVYTCGQCGLKRKLKGLAARKNNKKCKDHTVEAKKTVAKRAREEASLDLDKDFVRIGRPKRIPAKLEQRRKKKKKRDNNQKGSNLLDFLSSLNDT